MDKFKDTLLHSILRHMDRGVLPILKHSFAAMELGLCDKHAKLTEQGKRVLEMLNSASGIDNAV